MIKAIFPIGFFIFYFTTAQVFAAEKLGVLNVDDVLLRPYFIVTEGQDAEFGLGETSLAVSWTKSQNLGGVIRLGPKYLMSPMLHFTDNASSDLGIVEAFAQVSGVYGKFRMGLIPIEFGIEGQWQESEIQFPRSLIFLNRLVPLRDFGLSYQVGNNGYYTRLAIHNGESESENKDGRMFFTASWGWSNYRNLDVGISSMTGTTKPESTQGVTKDFLASVDVNEEALWRLGEFYFYWHPNNWSFLTEILFGELDQNKKVTKFHAGHVDLGYRWSPYLKSIARYDHFDPNDEREDDLQRRASVALVFSDKYETNSLYVLATKIYEQGSNIHNDEMQIIWRLTPRYQENP